MKTRMLFSSLRGSTVAQVAACQTDAAPSVKEVRGRGLMIAVELHAEAGGARRVCEALQARGLLAKETHDQTIRIAPSLI